MSTAEVVLHQGQGELAMVSAQDFMPIFGIEQAVARQKAMSEFIGTILKEDIDYGVIPGTNKEYGVIPGTNKEKVLKVLKKPGAEKLCTFFGLTPRFEAEETTEDWSGDEHGGEPLFYYRYKCQLWRGERLLAEAVGSCNSREKKYRYRSGERVCPECAKPAIIKGKAEYGGGFICFAKKGGCGAKFRDDDQAIIGQEVGQIKNPDIYDVINTCQKMAQKRALVATVLIGTNASDSFTQDLDEDAEPKSSVPKTTAAPPVATAMEQKGGAATAPAPPDSTLAAILEKVRSLSTREEGLRELCASLEGAIGGGGLDQVWAEALRMHGDPDKSVASAEQVARHLYAALLRAIGKEVAA